MLHGDRTADIDAVEEMKKQVLFDIADTETEIESYNTWHIENWRTLQRREHGPIFTCGEGTIPSTLLPVW